MVMLCGRNKGANRDEWLTPHEFKVLRNYYIQISCATCCLGLFMPV
jgi:hypothetical protein